MTKRELKFEISASITLVLAELISWWFTFTYLVGFCPPRVFRRELALKIFIVLESWDPQTN